jgi:ABC-type nitrate/sulfonate/bicarbonate transport system substrate-binding protein
MGPGAIARSPARLAVPDLVSPSYFPAIAAVELGLLADEGFDAEIELIFPVSEAMDALRTGRVDLVAGAAHATLTAFPGWHGAKLLGALSRHMYWFLVVRADLGVARGDLSALRGLRIGAAPGVDLGLERLLVDEGVALGPDGVEIVPVPVPEDGGISFGVNAAAALAAGQVDGFWANGMGSEVAVRDGTGTLVLDVRRGDGPPAARGYTFAALVATDETLRERPALARGAVRALVRAQAMLRADPRHATRIGRKLFPPREASLIAELVARDAPYFDAEVGTDAVATLDAFTRAVGLSSEAVSYGDVVAAELRPCWTSDEVEAPGGRAAAERAAP